MPPTAYPKITVITPSFNQGCYLEQIICSVLEQGDPNLEYILIDGNSHDESRSIIERYAAHFAYWHSELDRGQGAAINARLPLFPFLSTYLWSKLVSALRLMVALWGVSRRTRRSQRLT
ncbi:MAG TPA: glycosyltransferase [Aggregatilineales bacterium]|nr:glycosyltransferase [Anaerolineales bacterium]HRE48198.1 glycosyltransferase [Aggregatilineales bacterium]